MFSMIPTKTSASIGLPFSTSGSDSTTLIGFIGVCWLRCDVKYKAIAVPAIAPNTAPHVPMNAPAAPPRAVPPNAIEYCSFLRAAGFVVSTSLIEVGFLFLIEGFFWVSSMAIDCWALNKLIAA